MLKKSDQIKTDSLFTYGIIGELSLNGFIRPAKGILSMASEAKALGINKLILPAENLAEARLISGIKCYGFETLKDVINFLEKTETYEDPVCKADFTAMQIKRRPFCAPHSNASLNSLIGGGNPAQPGEISVAHNGVLFLDELPEFPRSVIESLRQPLENRKVTVTRVGGTNTFPSNFMLVAAMNPCPCGYYPSRRCHCSDYEIKAYRSKISGPILERIDIQKEVRAVDYFDYK